MKNKPKEQDGKSNVPWGQARERVASVKKQQEKLDKKDNMVNKALEFAKKKKASEAQQRENTKRDKFNKFEDHYKIKQQSAMDKAKYLSKAKLFKKSDDWEMKDLTEIWL